MEEEAERSGQKLGGLEKAEPAELEGGEVFRGNRGQGAKVLHLLIWGPAEEGSLVGYCGV